MNAQPHIHTVQHLIMADGIGPMPNYQILFLSLSNFVIKLSFI
jgi:hypothetical protein